MNFGFKNDYLNSPGGYVLERCEIWFFQGSVPKVTSLCCPLRPALVPASYEKPIVRSCCILIYSTYHSVFFYLYISVSEQPLNF